MDAFIADIAVSASGCPDNLALWAETVRFEEFKQVHEVKFRVLADVTGVLKPTHTAEKNT